MSQTDNIQSLHQALTSLGVKDNDIHFMLDWIMDDLREEKRFWHIISSIVFGIGMVLGFVIGKLW